MKTKLSLAVAAAMFAASSAQAGISIPAGDWTLDIGGVVNAYYTNTTTSGDFENGLGSAAVLGGKNAGDDSQSNITTGLLPNYLSVSGKTRQNDLDVAFTISLNPGASTTNSGIQGSQQENRQAFLTFGDASWGSIKLGKDLGIFASDAILNDMTLLGVGSGAGFLAGNTTTLGRIGTGFIYADWKSQIAYTSPNWNGFQFTAGVTQAWNAITANGTATLSDGTTVGETGSFDSAYSASRGGSNPAFEAKASYAWEGDVAGKVWVSGLSQKIEGLTSLNTGTAQANANRVTDDSDTATAWDIGTTINVAGFGLTAYYSEGEGTGTTVQFRDGYDNTGNARDSEDWYLQATYAIPGAGTKLGFSYGESELEGNTADAFDTYENSMWTVGVYHPITKHLNLVAEYSDVETEIDSAEGESKTISLGAILFF